MAFRIYESCEKVRCVQICRHEYTVPRRNIYIDITNDTQASKSVCIFKARIYALTADHYIGHFVALLVGV